MKAAITGSNGFVGGHLTAYLESCGDTVDGMMDVDSNPVDVTDPSAIETAISNAQPDVVYHLAALTHVGESWSNPNAVWRVNTEGTANVMRAAARVRARVIVVSSADAYGNAANRARVAGSLLDETTPLEPMSPYGASKAACELLAMQQARSGQADVVVARAFNHTGPNQSTRFAAPALADRIAAAEAHNENVIHVGSLEAVRDIAHVADIARAYRMLAEHGSSGEVYNVCTGRGVEVAFIAHTLMQQASVSMTLNTDPELVRAVEVPWLIGDFTKLHDATGWEPKYSLEETLSELLVSARERYRTTTV